MECIPITLKQGGGNAVRAVAPLPLFPFSPFTFLLLFSCDLFVFLYPVFCFRRFDLDKLKPLYAHTMI